MVTTNKTRNLIVLFHGRFPSEKAASLFAAKSADAFSALGYSVTLVVPRRLGRAKADMATYYSIPGRFRVVYVPTLDLIWLRAAHRVAFRISLIAFSISSFFFLMRKSDRMDIIYSNESLPLFLASFRFPRVCFEMHDYSERAKWFYHALFRRIPHILMTTRWKMERFKNDFPDCAAKSFYEPNAVSVEEFSISVPREEARRQLGIPQNVRIVVYTGHLYAWKGVDTLAEAARFLPGIKVFIVGGTEQDIETFRTRWKNAPSVLVVGHKPHREIPLWQKAADVLVLPNTAKEKISTHYTSPMKLFEYMASGTPVVASDIPSVREIAGDDRVILVEADNSEALAAGIMRALDGQTSAYTQSALAWVREHSWLKRAERIAAVLEKEAV